jgi:transcriptional regulator of acetoin/glycerol metabolism
MLAISEYLESGLARGFDTAILGSWERSRAAGLNPYDRNVPTPLEDRAYRARLEARGDILELFQHFTGRFAGVLDQLGAVSFVCDGDGYLLSRIGAAESLRRFDHVSIREGSSCSEAVLGTNAPSLALVTREPVMVTADEHYSRLYHTAFCVAAPILDEERTPIGCIDITKFFDRNDVSPRMRKDLLQLAISLTDAIRTELSLRRLGRLGPAAPRSAVLAPLDASHATFAQIVGRRRVPRCSRRSTRRTRRSRRSSGARRGSPRWSASRARTARRTRTSSSRARRGRARSSSRARSTTRAAARRGSSSP